MIFRDNCSYILFRSRSAYAESRDGRSSCRSSHHPQRIPGSGSAYVCEISVLFFVFRCTLACSTVFLFSSLPVFNFSNRNNKSEPMTNRQKVRIILFWWTRRGSNPRPLGCEPNALPAELRAHVVDLTTIPQQGKIVKLVLKKVRRCCSA